MKTVTMCADHLDGFMMCGNIPCCEIAMCRKDATDYFISKTGEPMWFCKEHFKEVLHEICWKKRTPDGEK